MKKIILLAVTGLLLSFATQAQKIGHLNIQEIMVSMPEYKTAGSELETFSKDYQTQASSMQQELETKYNDYLKNQKTFTEAIREAKEKELQSLQQRMQDYSASAQEKITKKENELMEPIVKKLTDAIKTVANEKGYDYVLETSATHFASPALDMSSAVKAKLGIK